MPAEAAGGCVGRGYQHTGAVTVAVLDEQCVATAFTDVGHAETADPIGAAAAVGFVTSEDVSLVVPVGEIVGAVACDGVENGVLHRHRRVIAVVHSPTIAHSVPIVSLAAGLRIGKTEDAATLTVKWRAVGCVPEDVVVNRAESVGTVFVCVSCGFDCICREGEKQQQCYEIVIIHKALWNVCGKGIKNKHDDKVISSAFRYFRPQSGIIHTSDGLFARNRISSPFIRRPHAVLPRNSVVAATHSK